MAVAKVAGRKVSAYHDFYENTFRKPGERQDGRMIRAQGINTLDEAPDGDWYTSRHYKNPMTLQELVRGVGNENPPSRQEPWKVVSAKTEGITPGFTIKDVEGRTYLVKFDPVANPEMASAADVVTPKFLYALGYNVPENYIIYFNREQVRVALDAKMTNREGEKRPMTEQDIDAILRRVPRDPQKGYRAIASRYITGDILGPFLYYGTRSDDPNDIVPHEHRRDLRGLFVFAAWLGHTDAKALNTLDTVMEENGARHVKHYLIDFGSSLGSGSTAAKDPRSGNEYVVDWKPAALHLFTAGLYVPRWARARYPDLPSVGRFEWEAFDPEHWKSNYPVPAFDNRLPDDTFWAAKQVMAFTNDEIRAIVNTGEYSDPEAAQWIADCLIARRDKIGKAYFDKVLPLDRFTVRQGRLVFEDLAAKYHLTPSRDYTVQWSSFDNDKEQKAPLPNETTLALPKQLAEAATGAYYAADIHGNDANKAVTVYLRKGSDRVEVVGIDRTWRQRGSRGIADGRK